MADLFHGSYRWREVKGCGEGFAKLVRVADAVVSAGGGLKGGVQLGKTDEFGFNAVEDKVHVHDLHATILHRPIFDQPANLHAQGRDFRFTDVHGNVVNKVLA